MEDFTKLELVLTRGDRRWIITKKDNLYNFEYQEYFESIDKWRTFSKDYRYTKEALELILDFKLDF